MKDDTNVEREPSLTSTAYSEKQAHQYDSLRFESPAGSFLHQRELTILMRAIQLTGDAKILEVGCGTGRLLLAAREIGYSVDGVDASRHMLDQLERKHSGRWPALRLDHATADALPYSSNSFGLVYAIRLLNQTGSTDYALRVIEEMCRVTQDEGIVLIEFANHYRPRWGMAKAKSVRLQPNTVVHIAERNGCKRERLYGAFFLSMQAYGKVPVGLLPFLDRLDRLASLAFPRLSSRCYLLARKVPKHCG